MLQALPCIVLFARLCFAVPAPQMEASTWTRARMSTDSESGITTTIFVTGTTTINLATITPTPTPALGSMNDNAAGAGMKNNPSSSFFGDVMSSSSVSTAVGAAESIVGSEAIISGPTSKSGTMVTVMIAIATTVMACLLLIGLVYTLIRLRKHRQTERELRGAVFGVNNVNVKQPKNAVIDQFKQRIGRQISMSRRASFRAYVPKERVINPQPTSARIMGAMEPSLPRPAWSNRDPASLKSEIHIYPEDRPYFNRLLHQSWESLKNFFSRSTGPSTQSQQYYGQSQGHYRHEQPTVVMMKKSPSKSKYDQTTLSKPPASNQSVAAPAAPAATANSNRTAVVNQSRFSADPTTPQQPSFQQSQSWLSKFMKGQSPPPSQQAPKVNEVYTTQIVERHISPGESFLPDF